MLSQVKFQGSFTVLKVTEFNDANLIKYETNPNSAVKKLQQDKSVSQGLANPQTDQIDQFFR